MASPKFKYVGDPNEGKPEIPDEYEFMGLTFHKGRAKAVEDEHIAGKCAGNNHFAEANGSKKDSKE